MSKFGTFTSTFFFAGALAASSLAAHSDSCYSYDSDSCYSYSSDSCYSYDSDSCYSYSPEPDSCSCKNDVFLDYRIEVTFDMDSCSSSSSSSSCSSSPSSSSCSSSSSSSSSCSSDSSSSCLSSGEVGPFTSVYNGQRLLVGTYETFQVLTSDVRLDSGVYVSLSQPLSDAHEPCNGSSLDNTQTIYLYGVNGVLGALFEGKSALNKPNKITFFKKQGIYQSWNHPSGPSVVIDCEASNDQLIYVGSVHIN